MKKRRKPIATGQRYAKLTPIELLQQAILEQAVNDIVQAPWEGGYQISDTRKCSIREGMEAVDYVIYTLKMNGYTHSRIEEILNEIVPESKLPYVRDHLKGKYEIGGK